MAEANKEIIKTLKKEYKNVFFYPPKYYVCNIDGVGFDVFEGLKFRTTVLSLNALCEWFKEELKDELEEK